MNSGDIYNNSFVTGVYDSFDDTDTPTIYLKSCTLKKDTGPWLKGQEVDNLSISTRMGENGLVSIGLHQYGHAGRGTSQYHYFEVML